MERISEAPLLVPLDNIQMLRQSQSLTTPSPHQARNSHKQHRAKRGGEDIANCKERTRLMGNQSGSLLPSTLANSRLIVTAKKLHTQSDAVVPGFWNDAHKPGIEGLIKHILLVRVVVTVALEYL